MHLTPCELHTLPDGLVVCHAGIPASSFFPSQHSSCNSSADDGFTATLVQNGLAMPVVLLGLTLMLLSMTPAMDAKPIHILSMLSFCLALVVIA